MSFEECIHSAVSPPYLRVTSEDSTPEDSANCRLIDRTDAEHAEKEGPLYLAILYKGLEHPQIWVSPADTEG